MAGCRFLFTGVAWSWLGPAEINSLGAERRLALPRSTEPVSQWHARFECHAGILITSRKYENETYQCNTLNRDYRFPKSDKEMVIRRLSCKLHRTCHRLSIRNALANPTLSPNCIPSQHPKPGTPSSALPDLNPSPHHLYSPRPSCSPQPSSALRLSSRPLSAAA